MLLGHILFIALLVGSCELYRQRRVARQEAENAADRARIAEEVRREQQLRAREQRGAASNPPTWPTTGEPRWPGDVNRLFTERGVAKAGDNAVLGVYSMVSLCSTAEGVKRMARVNETEDAIGLAIQMARGRVWHIEAGTRCKVLAVGEGWCQVKILDDWTTVAVAEADDNPSRTGYVALKDVYTKP